MSDTLTADRDSGYGVLLTTVAATLDGSDPGAAQALRRAAQNIEETIASERALREVCLPVVELYGLRWAKDSHYYAAAEALGIEEPDDA